MFRAVSNHASSDLWEMEHPPWETEITRPDFPSKAKFRKWYQQEDTDHVFFTLVESINPHRRVEADNPPLCLYGWVADYDVESAGEITVDEFKRKVALMDVELRPTHFSETFSGGIRAVWEFEEKVWVDCPEVAAKFMKSFALRVKANKLASGLDTASYELQMLWEIGYNWEEVEDGMKTPAFITQQLLRESIVQTKKVSSKYTDLPMDKIKEEIDRLYPGRLYGALFEIGERIPLFWLPKCGDGKEKDKSAIVAEWGCHSFSSRSEKGNMFWDEILGTEFIQKFNEKKVGEAVDGCYYDGKGYWRIGQRGYWQGSNREDTMLYLKVDRGLSSTKKPKETASEAEQVLYGIQTMNRVDASAPFTHTEDKFVDWNGERYLNINQKKPMKPSGEGTGLPENFPWLHTFWANFVERHEDDICHPREFLLAELQRGYRSFLTSRPSSGHAIIMAGPTGKGKSFLTTFILREMFGSATDAGGFLVEGSKFTKELAESAVWYVDDNESTSNVANHKRFSEYVKKHIATPEVQYQPKFKDSRTVPWWGRVFITCNEDPDSIGIIPDLDINNREKIALFKINENFQADFCADTLQTIQMVRQEMPYFLRWLLDEFEPDPENVLQPGNNRYGIHPYAHPELVETAREASNQYQLAGVLDLWRDQQLVEKVSSWSGSSAKLLVALKDQDSEVRELVRSYNATYFGRMISTLDKQGGLDWLSRGTKNNSAFWTIKMPKKGEESE